MVSKNQRSFIIRRGNLQGIALGQRSIFSSPDFSLAAKVLEVNREYSLWTPVAQDAKVPFSKGGMITYEQSPTAIWSQIAKYTSEMEGQKKFKQSDHGRFSSRSFYDQSDPIHSLSIRGTLSMALRESNSNITPDQLGARRGFQLELSYNRPISSTISWSLGGRYDYESMATQNPPDSAFFSRYLLTTDLRFNLHRFKGRRIKKLYGGIGAAFGLSNAIFPQTVATGTAMVLPIVRLGLEISNANQSNSFLIEWITEGVADSLTDENSQALSSNTISTKLAAGLSW